MKKVTVFAVALLIMLTALWAVDYKVHASPQALYTSFRFAAVTGNANKVSFLFYPKYRGSTQLMLNALKDLLRETAPAWPADLPNTSPFDDRLMTYSVPYTLSDGSRYRMDLYFAKVGNRWYIARF